MKTENPETKIDLFEKFLDSNENAQLLPDVPAEDYHARRDFVSKHALDLFAESPEKYRYATDHPEPTGEKSPALLFGEALHALVLEPDKFSNEFARIPDEIKQRRGKAWDEFAAANAGKRLMFGTEFDRLEQMKKALTKHELANKLLFHGHGNNEITALFHHPLADQRPCKARIDRLLCKERTIIDLKTTTNAAPKEFARSVANFRYDVQGAFYIDAMEAATKLDGWRFAIVAIEKEPPFAVAVYYLDRWIDLGRETYLSDLQLLNECEVVDSWEGYRVSGDVLPSPEDWVLKARQFI